MKQDVVSVGEALFKEHVEKIRQLRPIPPSIT